MQYGVKPVNILMTRLVIVVVFSLPLPLGAIELELWAEGFEQITDIKFLDSKQQALIAQKTGELYLLDIETKQKSRLRTFDVNASSEMGLLGVLPWEDALYVYYSPKGQSETRLSRFDWPDMDLIHSKEHVLLTLIQPFSNHNGGALIKGPDNSILLSLGDGGAAGDPHNNGQNPQTLLGSIIRIVPDTDSRKGYQIPTGNLHEWVTHAQPEILAMGLRNAWKISMTNSGDLWIADVGQNSFEEINVIHAEAIGKGELNLGWKILEGHSCYRKANCQSSEYWSPLVTYSHQEYGQSITGGFLYEGTEVQELIGKYLFADFVSGFIGSLSPPSYSEIEPIITQVTGNWSTFARDRNNELYIADFQGKIYRIQSGR